MRKRLRRGANATNPPIPQVKLPPDGKDGLVFLETLHRTRTKKRPHNNLRVVHFTISARARSRSRRKRNCQKFQPHSAFRKILPSPKRAPPPPLFSKNLLNLPRFQRWALLLTMFPQSTRSHKPKRRQLFPRRPLRTSPRPRMFPSVIIRSMGRRSWLPLHRFHRPLRFPNPSQRRIAMATPISAHWQPRWLPSARCAKDQDG